MSSHLSLCARLERWCGRECPRRSTTLLHHAFCSDSDTDCLNGCHHDGPPTPVTKLKPTTLTRHCGWKLKPEFHFPLFLYDLIIQFFWTNLIIQLTQNKRESLNGRHCSHKIDRPELSFFSCHVLEREDAWQVAVFSFLFLIKKEAFLDYLTALHLGLF
jgi:hypothetical protein